MPESDDLLDERAAAENRQDARTAAIVTSVSLAMVVAASLLVVAGGLPV
jgi:hypothetical protein